MNNTEYDLLSKEQLVVMLEDAQSQIARMEDDCCSLQSQVDDLERDISCMVWPEDTCGCCA